MLQAEFDFSLAQFVYDRRRWDDIMPNKTFVADISPQ